MLLFKLISLTCQTLVLAKCYVLILVKCLGVLKHSKRRYLNPIWYYRFRRASHTST